MGLFDFLNQAAHAGVYPDQQDVLWEGLILGSAKGRGGKYKRARGTISPLVESLCLF